MVPKNCWSGVVHRPDSLADFQPTELNHWI